MAIRLSVPPQLAPIRKCFKPSSMALMRSRSWLCKRMVSKPLPELKYRLKR